MTRDDADKIADALTSRLITLTLLASWAFAISALLEHC